MIYNVMLNSKNGKSLNGGNTNIMQYYFDWGQLPEGKYELSFTFVSDNITFVYNVNTNSPIIIATDLGSNVYSNNTSIISALGMAVSNTLFVNGNNNYFTSSPNALPITNMTTILYNRPYNNIFNILLTNNLNQLSTLFTNVGYTLTLTFRKLD